MLRRNALLLTTTAATSRAKSFTVFGKRATASVSAPNGSFYFNNFINSGEMMQGRGVPSTLSERSQQDQSQLIHNGLYKVAWHKKPTDVFKRGSWSWKPARLCIMMMNAPSTQKRRRRRRSGSGAGNYHIVERKKERMETGQTAAKVMRIRKMLSSMVR